MDLLFPLKLLVIAGAAACLLALGWQFVRTLRFGRRGDPSVPSGSAAAGILYAFGPGMAPWAKESARAHLPTWIAGVLYHVAAFSAFALLGLNIADRLPSRDLDLVFRVVLVAGLAAGLGLLVKRLTSPALHPISCPDDFVANALVDGFLALSLASTWAGETGWGTAALPLSMLWGTVLLLYVPFGKIRHCFFFFYTRVLFGRFFGRRGVLTGGGS